MVAKTATYAIVDRSFLGRALDIGKGAVTGEVAKVNKLREINEQELKECE